MSTIYVEVAVVLPVINTYYYRVQAYNFRTHLSNKEGRIPFPKPAGTRQRPRSGEMPFICPYASQGFAKGCRYPATFPETRLCNSLQVASIAGRNAASDGFV